jgi:hypothetical protein
LLSNLPLELRTAKTLYTRFLNSFNAQRDRPVWKNGLVDDSVCRDSIQGFDLHLYAVVLVSLLSIGISKLAWCQFLFEKWNGNLKIVRFSCSIATLPKSLKKRVQLPIRNAKWNHCRLSIQTYIMIPALNMWRALMKMCLMCQFICKCTNT